MFDMGITEMMLIGIVALVVIGPERLPGVARTAGKYVGRLKRFMTSVRADVEQELRADELRQILADQQKELNSLKQTITEAGRDIEKQLSVTETLNEKAGQVGDTDPVAPAVAASTAEPSPSEDPEPPQSTTKESISKTGS